MNASFTNVSIRFCVLLFLLLGGLRGETAFPSTPLPKNLALERLLELPPEELGKRDIAEVNLICADGLPGSGHIDIAANLAELDKWAALVQAVIKQNYHRFQENPAEYNNSEGLYKMVMLVLTLQQDIGVKYNPTSMGIFADPKKPPTEEAIKAELADDRFYLDSKYVFLDGIIGKEHMGTCASMPVIYVAVGRRLGFPVKLVSTKTHCFVRWEGEGQRFNVEGTGGMDSPTDDFYRKWPLPVSQDEIDSGQYLKSLSAPEELAMFLENRATCLESHNRYAEALVALSAAYRLTPKNTNLQVGLAKAAQLVSEGDDRLPDPDPSWVDKTARQQPSSLPPSGNPQKSK